MLARTFLPHTAGERAPAETCSEVPARKLERDWQLYVYAFMPSLRKATNLQRRIDNGRLRLADLNQEEQEQLRQLKDNTLLDEANKAISEYGHGTLRDTQNRTMQIGGSTGGLTRVILDGFKEPDATAFLRRR